MLRRALVPLVAALLLNAPAALGQCDDLAPAVVLGPVDNPTLAEQVMATAVISRPNAAAIRLYFGGGENLPTGTYLRVTSIADSLTQSIDSQEISDWRWTSAWFNGDSVWLELVCGPNTTGNTIRVIRTCEPSETVPESGCPACEDPPPLSSVAWSCRLFGNTTGKCSAAMWSTRGCLITARHCSQTVGDVAEFNVPPSTSTGQMQHPAPHDQYIIQGRVQAPSNPPVDWAVLKLGPSAGLTAFKRQGQLRRIGSAVTPSVGLSITAPGYGAAPGTANYAQKETIGVVSSDPSGPQAVGFYFSGYSQEGNSGGGVTIQGGTPTSVQVLAGVFNSLCWGTPPCNSLAFSVNIPAFAQAREDLCQDCLRDCDGDGSVGAGDRIIFLGWLASLDPMADINGDGLVNSTDLMFYDDVDVACVYKH